MSVEAMTWALKQVTGSVGHKATLLAIADRAGFYGECWPSQQRLADETEQSKRTIIRQLADLEERGFIQRTPRYRHDADGGRSSDLIVVLMDGREALPRKFAEGIGANLSPKSKGGIGDNGDGVRCQPEQAYVTPVSPQEPSVEPSVEPSATRALQPLEIIDGRFDLFWFEYPRKVGKPQARKAFDKLMKTVDAEDIMWGLQPWVRYWEDRGDPNFIPHPTTWLNRRGWEDEPPANGRKMAPGMAAIKRNLERAQREA